MRMGRAPRSALTPEFPVNAGRAGASRIRKNSDRVVGRAALPHSVPERYAADNQKSCVNGTACRGITPHVRKDKRINVLIVATY